MAETYNKGLTDHVIKPIFLNNDSHVFHIYNIRTQKRDELKEFLLENGINTEIHYPVSPNNQEGYQDYFKDTVSPISQEIHQTTLSLPISYATTQEEVLKIIEKVNIFFEAK